MSASGCVFSWPALPALVYTPRRCRRVECVWGPMSAGSLRDAPLLVLCACAAHGALASVVGTQPLCRGGLYTIYSLHAWSTKAGLTVLTLGVRLGAPLVAQDFWEVRV